MAGPITNWLSLPQHLDDCAEIAVTLWDEPFWSAGLRQHLTTVCGGDEAVARAAIELLAALHDVGKVSPAFVAQVPELALRAQHAGLPLHEGVGQDPDRPLVRHEIVSYLAFKGWLADRAARPRYDPAFGLATVIGSHHGRPLLSSHTQLAAAHPHLSGDGAWQQVQRELIEWAVARPNIAPVLDQILAVEWSQHDLVTLTAMTVVADWVASDEEYFPLMDLGAHALMSAPQRAREAWQRYDPPPPSGSPRRGQITKR